MTTEEKFNKMVKEGKKIYLSKDSDIKEYLKKRKKQVKIEFKGLKLYINKNYKCNTCGSNKNHPDTGYCFICDTDNWRLV